MGHASLERARPAFSGLCTFVSRIYTGETIIKWHQRNKFRNKALSLSPALFCSLKRTERTTSGSGLVCYSGLVKISSGCPFF